MWHHSDDMEHRQHQTSKPPAWLQQRILLVLAFLAINLAATLLYRNDIILGKTHRKQTNKQDRNKQTSKKTRVIMMLYCRLSVISKLWVPRSETANIYKTNNTFLLSFPMTPNVFREFTYSSIFKLMKWSLQWQRFVLLSHWDWQYPNSFRHD